MRRQSNKPRNYVAKHARTFNRASVHKNKKKATKTETYGKYVPPEFSDYVPPTIYRREGTQNIPSRVTAVSIEGTRKESAKYTGDQLVGIATMHKSNMVPVFKGQDAIDIARMRRG